MKAGWQFVSLLVVTVACVVLITAAEARQAESSTSRVEVLEAVDRIGPMVLLPGSRQALVIVGGWKEPSIAFWNLDHGEVVQTLELGDYASHLFVAPDGTKFLTSHTFGPTVMRRVADGRVLWKLRYTEEDQRCLGVTPDSQLVIARLDIPHEYYLIDATTGRHVRLVRAGTVEIGSIGPQGRLLALSDRLGKSGRVSVREIFTGKEVASTVLGEGSIRTVDFACDGRRLALASKRRVALYDIQTDRLAMLADDEHTEFTSIRFSATAQLVLVGGAAGDQQHGVLMLYHRPTGELKWETRLPAPVSQVAFGPLAERIYAVMTDRAIAVVDRRTGNLLAELRSFQKAKRWLATTSKGFLRASPGAAELFEVRKAGRTVSGKEYARKYQNRDEVVKILNPVAGLLTSGEPSPPTP